LRGTRPHDEVLATRREACAVRARIGLPAGDVFLAEGDPGPMVFWSCAFANEDERAADLQARADSAEFEAVRVRMRALIDRFERRVMRNAGHAAGVIRSTAIRELPIRPRDEVFESQGRTLQGYLYLPPGEGPFPCMITNHGSTISQGTADVCRPGVAALLMSWGIASFLPHRHGYGNSPGPAWRSEVNADFGTDAYDKQIAGRLARESEDVIEALQHLRSLPEIDAAHIGVMGSSFGGTMTLLASGRTDRFRCAVEFAGAAMNWEQTPRLRASMLEAARIGTCPIYFIQAANDFSTAPTRELAASLEGSVRTVESKIFPDFGLTREEGHQFCANGGLVWGPEVRRFLELHL